MVLNPWVFGMYVSLLGMTVLYIYALGISFQIARNWDVNSMEEGQLSLERKTYLASTIVQYGLGIQLLSIILFYMTLESLSEVLPGAMCATGSVQANSYGFPALFVKMATALACALWIAIHHVDSKLEDYYLTRFKFKFLLVLAPFFLGDLVLQFLYFLNLDPDVITSCCGVTFEIEAVGFGSSLASLPPYPMMAAFFFAIPGLLVAGYFLSRKANPLGYYLYSCIGLIVFIISILAMISFIAPYIYQSPTLHCPFCVMLKDYHFVGYPLYIFIFGASFISVIPGFLESLKKKARHIKNAVGDLQRKAVRLSLILWFFLLVSAGLIIIIYEIRSPGAHLFY